MAILASGAGTNAERLMRAASGVPDVDIVLVACNRPDAGVLTRAEGCGVPTWVFDRSALLSGEVEARLRALEVDFVALAGFLMKIPEGLVKAFPGRMLNLHPSLLPAFGGKGMYGHHVHRAVAKALAAGIVQETGITLHWVDAEYDTGAPFFQVAAALDPADDAEAVAARIQRLES
ncbi:MAG: formyltransferase family protein, partial [Bacteroidota bacterium]|nr:formyltransferase family protein [Bacteroidota bacterium]